MIYPPTFEQRIGFDTIRDKLKAYCLSAMGMQWVDDMAFTHHENDVRVALLRTDEFKNIWQQDAPFPSQHFYDARDWLQKIRLEGNWLEAEHFLMLARSLETIQSARKFLEKHANVFPTLYALAQPVKVSDDLAKAVYAVVNDNAQVKDHASPELSSIRRRLREERMRLRKVADQIFKNAVEEKWVPEGAGPTIRDGRVVIPLHAEHKRRLKGFIHDESATGQTVFIEPAAMLEINNEIRDLEHAEAREVIRILRDLTSAFRTHLPELEAAFNFLSHLDFIRAKAKFALEIDAHLPVLVSKPGLKWHKARHPLLFLSLKGKRDVVPLDIQLSEEKRMLLISGPNAGGKSVSLKTVGLLQYMVQCGMLIPAMESSQFGLFEHLFLDIGDQQSIENDLSTYSSHLKNMNVFIREANSSSLVLIDELGSGTDPDFGGAIAQTILEELLKRNAWCIATTHYYNLKIFAGQTAGVENAAMRFDETQMAPLYQLETGKPGSSFALEIARKIGLPAHLVERAETLVGKELSDLEDIVRTLDQEKNELIMRTTSLEEKERKLSAELSKYEHLSSELEAKKKAILTKAKEEAASLLRNTNKEIEKTIRHIRENRAEKKETRKVRKNLEGLNEILQQEDVQAPLPGPILSGDRVRLIGQDSVGTVLGIQGKQAQVQFGEINSLIKLDKLEKVSGTAAREEKRAVSTRLNLHEKRAVFNDTLDVRGKRAEEVIPLLQQFLDTAILLGQGELRIVHGKGEGILRKVVREELRHFGQVASVQDEHADRGGDGVTLVVLK